MPTAEQTIAALSMPFNATARVVIEDPRCAGCTNCPPEDRCLVDPADRARCEHCTTLLGRGMDGKWRHLGWPPEGTPAHSAAPVGASCDFCHGEPVRNAAGWIALGAPETLPCPRCGETHYA